MRGFKLEYHPDLPEQVGVVVETTGLKGGDAGHGGWTSAQFSCDAETIIVELEDSLGRKISADNIKAVSIRVEGDWETTGILDALAKIGLRVMLLQNETLVVGGS